LREKKKTTMMELKCDGGKKVPFHKWVDGDLACKDGADESSKLEKLSVPG